MFTTFAFYYIVMPRPKRKRRIQQAPKMLGFIPINVKDRLTEFDVELHIEEYESLRLADYDGLLHEEAALLMKISRPTFTRIYEVARKKMVKALVENKSVIIAGGQVDFEDDWYRCHDCDDVFIGNKHHCETTDEETSGLEHINSSLNKGVLVPENILSSKSLGYCECTACNHTQKKIQGVPCRTQDCPECGHKNMVREIANTKRKDA